MTRRMVGRGVIQSGVGVTLSLVHEASGLQLRRLEMVTSVTMFRRVEMVTRMVELRGAQRGGGVGGREEAAVAELALVGGADVEWSHHQGLLGVGKSCIGQ